MGSSSLVVLLFSHPVMSDPLWPHGLQHTRPPCPSPSPGVCPSSCSLHQWYASLTRDQTQALCIGNLESEPLGPPGKSLNAFLFLFEESSQWHSHLGRGKIFGALTGLYLGTPINLQSLEIYLMIIRACWLGAAGREKVFDNSDSSLLSLKTDPTLCLPLSKQVPPLEGS